MTTPRRGVDNPQITPAGTAALDEYLEKERAQVVAEAILLSSGRPIGAAEVVNAIGAIEARREHKRPDRLGYGLAGVVQRSMRLRLLAFATGLIYLGLTVWILLASDYKPEGANSDTFFLLISTTLVVGVLLTEALRRSARRERFAYEVESEDREGTVGARALDVSISMFQYSQRWASFEEQLRSLAVASGVEEAEAVSRAPIGDVLMALTRARVISPEIYAEIVALLRVRNELVHGSGVTSGDVRGAIHELRQTAQLLSEAR